VSDLRGALPTVLEADYLAEVRTPESLLPEGPPEIAIAGRSNVGKSTLLNRLAARHALARTSKTPGRTRGIIFYELAVRGPGGGEPRPLRFADLPGYGFAKVSKSERRGWGPLLEGYVKARRTLGLVLVLVDARRLVEAEDKQLIEWLASIDAPVQLIATKVDKLSASERGLVGARCKAIFGGWLPAFLAVSAQTGLGIDRLWSAILRAASVVDGRASDDGPDGDGGAPA
jgi:GTP-binding protein